MSNSLLELMVFGKRSGVMAAGRAQTIPHGRLTLNHFQRFRAEAKKHRGTNQVTSPVVLPAYTERAWRRVADYLPTLKEDIFMTDRPNLFRFATSELSQDAFLCWLLSWADGKCAEKDKALHETAVEFVRSIITKCRQPDSKEPFDIEIRKQHKFIDVLALIKQGDKEYGLLIEDKTNTSMHGNQLQRYKKTVEEEFQGRTPLRVYLKTGEISREVEVEEAGYLAYSREDFLKVLRNGEGKIDNAIFRDFYEYLEAKNDRYEAFRTKKVEDWVNDWNRNAWEGFYNELQERMWKRIPPEKLGWVYASNPAGGELVCFWGYTEYEGCEVYLEIHKKKEKKGGRYFLAFKVWKVPKDKSAQERRDLRRDLCNRLMESAKKFGWGDCVKKPARFGSGNSMIFCQTKEDNSDCWLAKNAAGMLDMEATMKKLEEAEKILRDAVQQNVA